LQKNYPNGFWLITFSKGQAVYLLWQKCIKYFGANFRKFEKRLTILLRENTDKHIQKRNNKFYPINTLDDKNSLEKLLFL
jgi:hypothetical protein